jgi:hypothetical protein
MIYLFMSVGHVLQQRAKEVKQSFSDAVPEWSFHPQARIKQSGTRDVIVLNRCQIAAKTGIINNQCDLKIQPQTPHIEIHGADKAQFAINQHAFGMQQTTFKLINLHPGRQQLSEEGAAGPTDQHRVVFAWQNNTHIDAALRCCANGVQQVVTGYEIGRGHDQIFTRGVDAVNNAW